MVWRRGGILAGVACLMLVFVGVVGASTGSLVRTHGARSQMSLAQAPAGLRAAVGRTLGPGAASGGVSQQELTPSDGAPNDAFGGSVAISGSTAVVGTPDKNNLEGAAYVFVRSGSSWTQQAELTPPDNSGGDGFGSSVAISGSTVLVGSPYSTVAGVAYVFVRSGSTWSEQAELSASQGGAWDAFGDEVALSGSTAVIGAPYGGEAYVFAQSGTTWTQEAELTASDGDALDGAVAIFTYPREPSRWTVVAGSPDGNSQMGAAYVFAGSGASWTQQAELTASDGAKYYQFGNSVAVSGATVVVGEVATSGKPGAAYVFVRSGTSWSQQAELTNSAAGGDFGWAVALYHNTAVISAPGPAPSGADVFERSGSAWSEKEELIGSDPSDTGTGRVAVDGSEAIVGAPGASVGGAAYVFQHI